MEKLHLTFNQIVIRFLNTSSLSWPSTVVDNQIANIFSIEGFFEHRTHQHHALHNRSIDPIRSNALTTTP